MPSEAQNVQARALSPTAIEITWDPPANTKGLLLRYELIYYPVGGKDDKVWSFLKILIKAYMGSDMRIARSSFRHIVHNMKGAFMGHEKTCLSYANKKGADQPEHSCSLISAVVVPCLESIINNDKTSKMTLRPTKIHTSLGICPV